MAQIRKDNLGYLGVDFQYRLISAFIVDPNFFKDFEPIIDQNMFSDLYLRTIVGVMKDYYRKYGTVPSYDILDILIKQKCNTDDDIQYYNETIDRIKKAGTDGILVVEDSAEKFFKQQNWLRVANEIKMVVGDGDIEKYDEFMDIINKAMAIGRHEIDTFSPFDNINEDMSQENVVTIPTGIDKLDEVLGGGIDKGKIGLIICPMGCGKTSMTTCVAANAASYKCEENNYEGYKVLQICFEDKPRDLRRKYISKATQIETAKLNENESIPNKVKTILSQFKDKEVINNNIKIMKLLTGEVDATEIKSRIIKLMNMGFKPDLVIIDYFECVNPERGTSKDDLTTREGKTMRKFENMAEELDIAMWIPTQGNRDSIDSELVTNAQVGGSIRKNQIAQVVLSITRSIEDMDNNRAIITVLKNRSGKAGRSLKGVYFNNGTCTISCDDVPDFGLDSNLAFNDEELSDIQKCLRK